MFNILVTKLDFAHVSICPAFSFLLMKDHSRHFRKIKLLIKLIKL